MYSFQSNFNFFYQPPKAEKQAKFSLFEFKFIFLQRTLTPTVQTYTLGLDNTTDCEWQGLFGYL